MYTMQYVVNWTKNDEFLSAATGDVSKNKPAENWKGTKAPAS